MPENKEKSVLREALEEVAKKRNQPIKNIIQEAIDQANASRINGDKNSNFIANESIQQIKDAFKKKGCK